MSLHLSVKHQSWIFIRLVAVVLKSPKRGLKERRRWKRTILAVNSSVSVKTSKTCHWGINGAITSQKRSKGEGRGREINGKNKDGYTMEVELPETFISSGKYYKIERFNITSSPNCWLKMEIQRERSSLSQIIVTIASIYCKFILKNLELSSYKWVELRIKLFF